MRHVVAADDVGGVRQPVRVPVARRAQQQRGGVDRARTRRRRCRRCRPPRRAVALDDDPRDRASGRVGLEPLDPRVRAQRDVRVLERGAHAEDVRVGLAVGQAGEAVEAVAANAAPGLGVGLVEVDPDGQVERLVPGPHEVVVRAAGSAARARRPGTGTGPSAAARSGPRRPGRGRGRAARPRRSRARGRRRRSARPARRRRGAGPRSKSRSRRRNRIAAVDLGVAADEVLRRAGGTRRRPCRTSVSVVT